MLRTNSSRSSSLMALKMNTLLSPMSSFTSCVYFLAANASISATQTPTAPRSNPSDPRPVRCPRSTAGTVKNSAAHSGLP